MRAAVTALAVAIPVNQVVVQAEPAIADKGALGVVPPKCSKAHYLWAVLIARIYRAFPLLCPICGGQMRLIAFIAEGVQIRNSLDHIGEDCEPPHKSPARGPPLWDDDGDAQMDDGALDDGAQIEPADWDLAAQAKRDFEVDQRISW